MNSIRCPLTPKGRIKNAKWPFSVKSALHLKKVCYKVCVNNVSNKILRHSLTGLSLRVKMVRGGRPLLRENLAKTELPLQKRRLPISIIL